MDRMLSPFVSRIASFFALATACISALQVLGQSQPTPVQQQVPVLVELFTSEGCSDCPPADDLLRQLDAKQPIAGVRAIVLSEHVTYWNHDGWHDPFSLDAMTERQESYVRRFGIDSSYTPQMVVDGATQFVGNDARALVAAVTNAAKTPKQPLSIENAKFDHGSVVFSIRSEALPHAKLYAALAADATRSEVTHGENAGRTLRHTAVVRALKEYSGKEPAGSSLKLPGISPAEAGGVDGPVRLVIFLVDSTTGRVLGAAEQPIQR